MDKEQKILSMLENLTTTVSAIQAEQQKTNQRLDKIEQDIEIIKEDTEITRSATNTLLDWAERAESVIEVAVSPHQK